MGLVLDILNNEVRKKITVNDKVLKEARKRRDLVAEAALEIEGALRWFRSGSVAHGWVNRPVTDADSGLVLDRRIHATLGPDGEGEGPEDIVDQLRDLVERKVRQEYPNTKVTKSRRGLLVEFNEPVTDKEDPTVDLIVTLTRKDADGLWIPDLDKDEWTPSHPEKHTDLFTGGTRELRSLRARVVRLAKAWNKQWDEGDRALSSFNIGALGWEYVTEPTVPLDEALAGWFRYAHDEVEKAETKDPAEVSDPIRLLKPKGIVLKRLASAAERLEHALANEDDEDAVRDDLATVYPDYVEPPAESKSAFARALRTNEGIGATATGIALGTGTTMKRTRTYGETGNG